MNVGQRGVVTIVTNMAGRGTLTSLGEGETLNSVDFVSSGQNVTKAVGW